MVENGVRINDFGIIARANRYYASNNANDIATTATAEQQETNTVDGKDDRTKNIKTERKIETRVEVNDSSMLLLWLSICSSVGSVCYIIFDQMVILAFFQRVLDKYILKTALDA